MLNYSERAQVRRYLLLAAGLVMLALAVLMLRLTFTPMAANYEVELARQQQLTSDIAGIEAQTESLESTIGGYGKTFYNIPQSKDAVVSYLGELARKNTVDLNKLQVEDPVADSGSNLISMTVNVQLGGQLYNIKTMVESLTGGDLICRINTVSYRINNQDASWMWRSVDDKNLITWWALSGNEEKEAQGETTDSAAKDGKKTPTVKELMLHTDALCYLELEFIGVQR